MLSDTENFSLRLFLGVLRRRWWVIVQTAAIAAAAAILLSLRSSTHYEARAVLLVGSPKQASIPGVSEGRELTAGVAARLASTRAVAARVGNALHTDFSVDELLARVTTAPDHRDGFVTITARGDSGVEAAMLANAFAKEFRDLRAETPFVSLRQAVQALQRQLRWSEGVERDTLLAQLTQIQTLSALPRADVEIVDPAVVPAESVGPRPIRNGVAGLALGLLLGIALALALEALDPRIRQLAELRRVVRAPQLAGVPATVFYRPLNVGRRRRGEPWVLEAYRHHPEPFERLRTSLLVFNAERKLNTIVVTSAYDEKEGKSTVAANLAVSLAKAGLKVCVVEADLRRPWLAWQFGLDDGAPGLVEVVAGEAKLADALQQFPVPDAPTFLKRNGKRSEPPVASIAVLAAGGKISSPAELLASKAVQDVLEKLEREHDVVIVSCAPLLAHGDGLPLVARADGTLLVVRLFHTPRAAAERAAQIVKGARGRVLGVVATGVPSRELREEGYGPWPVSRPESSRVG